MRLNQDIEKQTQKINKINNDYYNYKCYIL